MSNQFVLVAKKEGGVSRLLPTRSDGTLLLETLQSQFPGSTGLMYRAAVGENFYGILLAEGKLHPPVNQDWGNLKYLCVFPENKELPSETANIWCERILGFFIPKSLMKQKKD